MGIWPRRVGALLLLLGFALFIAVAMGFAGWSTTPPTELERQAMRLWGVAELVVLAGAALALITRVRWASYLAIAAIGLLLVALRIARELTFSNSITVAAPLGAAACLAWRVRPRSGET